MNLFYGKVIKGELVFDNKREVGEFFKTIEGKAVVVRIDRETGVRSEQQNRALHLFCEMSAKELNDAGWTVQLVLKHVVDLDWTKELFKELIWRPIQKALTGKTSTTKLDKVSEIDVTYDHINRYMGEKFHLHVPFPSEETKP